MRTVEKTVYLFSELSDEAKERAKDWWLSCRGPEDLEYTVEDFVAIAALLGLEIGERQWENTSGHKGSSPEVYWSGFYSQGSCAYFYGRYRYAKGALKAVKEYAPQDEELHRIARELQELQRKNFYKVCATISSDYYSRRDMGVELDHADDQYREFPAYVYDEVKELMNDLADWLWKRLREEDEYQSSDEALAEAMEANEYEFDEDGRRV